MDANISLMIYYNTITKEMIKPIIQECQLQCDHFVSVYRLLVGIPTGMDNRGVFFKLGEILTILPL